MSVVRSWQRWHCTVVVALACVATLRAGSVVAQDAGADPVQFGLPAGAGEILARRSLRAKHFQLPSGEVAAVVGSEPLH